MNSRAKPTHARTGSTVRALQTRALQARRRRQLAKKQARLAKLQARQARRLFKDAKKVAKRAKAELLALSKKLKRLLDGRVGAGGLAVKDAAPGRRKREKSSRKSRAKSVAKRGRSASPRRKAATARNA